MWKEEKMRAETAIKLGGHGPEGLPVTRRDDAKSARRDTLKHVQFAGNCLGRLANRSLRPL